ANKKKYDSSWDRRNEKLWNKKNEEWKKRDWEEWLNTNLSFPFQVERKNDKEDAYFTDIADREPFRLGHKMTVLGIEMEDDFYGVIVKVREGRRIGYVPLIDTEVVSRDDENFLPVRKYAVWFANR
ncbi:calcium-binding protein, partial [Thermodesulfobacteriota bacterium]